MAPTNGRSGKSRKGETGSMFTGSANVAAGAIDMDDAAAMAEKFGPPEDFDSGSQEVPEIIREAQKSGRTKGSTSKPRQTEAQKARAKAKKEKEAAAAKAKRDKERAEAKEKRDAEREAAKAAKAAAKEAGPDLTGLVPTKPSGKVSLQNVPLELLDGIDGGDPVDRAFVENVKLHGILQPIRVRATEDGRYNIVFGKRRSQAARANEFPTIPAIVEKEASANDYVQGLAENFARSHNAIEEHRMIMALIENYAETVGDPGANDRKAVAAIAKATGMTTSQIKKARRLGNLVPELVTAVEEGAMSSWAAEHASTFPVEVQRALVDTLNREGKITVDDVNVARRHRQHEAVSSAADAATASGQDMHSAPDVADDEGDEAPAAATPRTRVDKVARIVVLAREALSLAQSLSSPSADEVDAATYLEQIIANLTSSAV